MSIHWRHLYWMGFSLSLGTWKYGLAVFPLVWQWPVIKFFKLADCEGRMVFLHCGPLAIDVTHQKTLPPKEKVLEPILDAEPADELAIRGLI